MTPPLKNKVVLLLRVKLGPEAKRLKSLGAKVIHFPILNLKSLSSLHASRFTLHDPFDWLVFTSATGVHLFKKRFKALPAASKIAAIGPETAKALREAFGRSSDFVPSAFTTERLAEELLLASAKPSVLLIRSKNADKRMEAILAKRGACFKRLSLYEVTPKKLNPKIKSGLKEGKISHVFFGSASQARAFARNFIPDSAVELSPPRKRGSRFRGELDSRLRGNDGTKKCGVSESEGVSTAEPGFRRERLRAIFRKDKAQALAIGPETSKALKELGIQHKTAREHTFGGMIDLLING